MLLRISFNVSNAKSTESLGYCVNVINISVNNKTPFSHQIFDKICYALKNRGAVNCAKCQIFIQEVLVIPVNA